MNFKLTLSAINDDLLEAFRLHFSPYPEVDVVGVPFEMVDFDCVVSAANSFGLMDGGVDQSIADYFGVQLLDRVQREVIWHHGGMQPVGTSLIVRGTSGGSRIKYVATSPTMIIPQDIHHTKNVYFAMKAMLDAVERHNRNSFLDDILKPITHVVCPGLGTNTGRVPADDAARQMATAYHHFKNKPNNINWYFASKRFNEITSSSIERVETGYEDLIDLE